LEKSHKTGGLVNTFWHQGYAFDGGIRAFENSGILFPMLKGLGLNLDFVSNLVSIGLDF
jgi:protoporphyrinogen oxidase